jgi:effector-binding domain-containing protein
MLATAKIVKRTKQPYVPQSGCGVKQLGKMGPKLHKEVHRWLAAQGIEPAGRPFFKYNVIDMARGFEMEFGFPTARLMSGDERVLAAVLPAGRYASLIYRGPYKNLYDANAVLIGWAKERGIKWDVSETKAGDKFACRLEIYRTDEDKEPDPANWETEVTIRLASG